LTNTNQPLPCDVVIAFALAEEAGGLVDRLTDVNSVKASGFVVRTGRLGEVDVCVVETGVGGKAARRAVPAVLRAHRPTWVISAGFAGGLKDEIHRGELILPDCVVAPGQPEIALETQETLHALTSIAKRHRGRLVSVDEIVRLPDDKRALGERVDALAVDMETYAVALSCRERATPLLAVRVISDEAADELSADIAHIGQQATKVGRIGAALSSLVRRPSSAKDMLRLREQALIAGDTLADFLVAAIGRLCPKEEQEPRISTDETRIEQEFEQKDAEDAKKEGN
jgi:adenosylhomocysteine nucleosidase